MFCKQDKNNVMWRTREGALVAARDMSDEHLRNARNMLLREGMAHADHFRVIRDCIAGSYPADRQSLVSADRALGSTSFTSLLCSIERLDVFDAINREIERRETNIRAFASEMEQLLRPHPEEQAVLGTTNDASNIDLAVLSYSPSGRTSYMPCFVGGFYPKRTLAEVSVADGPDWDLLRVDYRELELAVLRQATGCVGPERSSSREDKLCQ